MTLAAQDFRHASHEGNEKVGDFFYRLEQLFKLAYGHDTISAETPSTLLYGQLQKGMRYRIMEAPAVSGAANYRALCLTAKAEEKRLTELKKCRQYRSETSKISLEVCNHLERKQARLTNRHSPSLEAELPLQTKEVKIYCWKVLEL